MKPDWRDPQMPVLMKVLYCDGTTGYAELPPEFVQEKAKKHIWNHRIGEPNWREDPTYNLRRRKNV